MKQTPLPPRTFNLLAIGAIGSAFPYTNETANAEASAPPPQVDLAVVATPSASFVSPDQDLAALRAPASPRNSRDHSHGSFGNWPKTGTQWIEYAWSRPISTNRMDVYFYSDGRGLRAPKSYRLQYWDGSAYVNLADAAGLETSLNRFNSTTFSEISTSRLRMEFDSAGAFSVGILRWRVYDSGKSPLLPPIVKAGPDRIVVSTGRTYLAGEIRSLPNIATISNWTKESGPGDVSFADAQFAVTAATFSRPGDYTLKFTADLAPRN